MGNIVLALICLAFSHQLSSAASHSLQYVSTAITQGTQFPEYTMVGLLDGHPFVYYDSHIMKVTPKTEWIRRNEEADFWSGESEVFKGEQEWSLGNMAKTMKRHNDTKGIHTWQWAYGCELHDNGTTRVYSKFAYDGQDYIRLDLNTGTFSAYMNAFLLNWDKALAGHCKDYLENDCFTELNTYVGYSRELLERKVPPEVSLFQRDSSSPVVCHATSFFPKAVVISWQKNGEDLYEDVDFRETLPNQDGTFQKRSLLTISPEELDRNQYTCVIHHEGLQKKLQVSDRRVLSGGGSVGLIIGAVVAVLLLVMVGCVGVLMWRKKKKSDFTPVPVSSTPVSTQDSESTSSSISST